MNFFFDERCGRTRLIATCLRLADPRVFDYVDFITLDDGEAPMLALIEHLRDPARPLFRTFVRAGKAVKLVSDDRHDVPIVAAGTPTYAGLALDRYVSLFEMLNPMHRLWSDGRWNKLTVAHGCYWKKCSFCDVSLDYIGRYDAATASTLADRIEAIVQETGQTGFHFVDEAAPPKALKALAAELQRRELAISWWGNVRFEKTFTPVKCIAPSRSPIARPARSPDLGFARAHGRCQTGGRHKARCRLGDFGARAGRPASNSPGRVLIQRGRSGDTPCSSTSTSTRTTPAAAACPRATPSAAPGRPGSTAWPSPT